MKQAILITAYKNFDHLVDISNFFDEEFEIYIHIDKKIKVDPLVISNLTSCSNVKLVSRKFRVNWGGRNHLKAILYLTKKALEQEENWFFHLISGHDYPIKKLSYFKSFFAQHSDKNYINHFEVPNAKWPNSGMDRLMYYNLYDLIDAKKHRHYIVKLNNLQRKYGVKRRISKQIPKLYGGETWWSLNKEAISFLIDYTKTKPRLFKRMKFTFCSEEIYVQMVLMNSHLHKTVINDSLRYIDWSSRNGNFPANLNIDDWEAIKTSNALFARKFEFPVSQELKLALMESNNQETSI